MPRLEASTPDEYIAQLPPGGLESYLDQYRAVRGSSRATRTATAG